MSQFPQSLTRLIHENLSIVATFAFSRAPLLAVRGKFEGEWKYLDKALFEISEQRAAKACLELATFVRMLDDDEEISKYLKQKGGGGFGRVSKTGKPDEPLYLRDLTNKIVHAERLEWDFSDPAAPKIICISRQPDRWLAAEIGVTELAAFCGQLMS